MKWLFLLLCSFSISGHPAAQSAAPDAVPILPRAQQKIPLLLLKWNSAALAPTGEAGLDDNATHYLRRGYFRAESVPGFDMGIEASITQRLTLDAGLRTVSGGAAPDLFFFRKIAKTTAWSQFHLEPRWYLCDRGPQANAPYGAYLGLRYASLWGFNPEQVLIRDGYPQREWRMSVQAGLQRRFARSGYIDFGYGLGWRDAEYAFSAIPGLIGSMAEVRYYRGVFISPRLAAGLAFGSKAHPSPAEQQARAATSRTKLQGWRIGLSGLIDWANHDRVRLELPVGYEYLLDRSSWSLVLEGRVRYSKTSWYYEPVFESGNGLEQWSAGATLEIRHFPGLKRRMTAGTAADIPTGIYWGIQGRWDNSRITGPGQVFVFDGVPPEVTGKYRRTVFAPMLGWQLRFFSHVYLNYQFGCGPAWAAELIDIKESHYRLSSFAYTEAHWFSDLKIGLNF